MDFGLVRDLIYGLWSGQSPNIWSLVWYEGLSLLLAVHPDTIVGARFELLINQLSSETHKVRGINL